MSSEDSSPFQSNWRGRQWTSPHLPQEWTPPTFRFHASSKYHPLQVFPQGSTAKPVRDFLAFPYRMNLVAASRRYPKVFIADEDQIRIITTPNSIGPSDPLKFESVKPRQFEDDDSTGYLVSQFPYAITNMRIGEIGGEEVLIAADDSGHAVLHFTKDNFSRQPLIFHLPLSAWGIDTHSRHRLLAISCNAHIVTLYHLGMGVEGWDWTTAAPAPGETVPSLVLRGHTNNIPCVAFDGTGKYIASGSIDGTIHIWYCKTGTSLKVVMSDNYVWSVRFVDKTDFRHYHRTEEERNIVEGGPRQRNVRSIIRAISDKWFSQSGDDPEMDWLATDIMEYLPKEEGSSKHGANPGESMWLEDDDEEVLNQLLISTEGTNLCLYDPWMRSPRRVRRDIKSEIDHDHEYFCILDLVPSMSMLYTASPTRTAWLHRLIYYPDTDIYDLVPEYGFPDSPHPPQLTRGWPNNQYKYCGAVVQPLRFAERTEGEEDGEKKGDILEDGGTGITVVAITSRGEGCWWTVKRGDEDEGYVGVEGIVL